ncbi:unnamed protein product [Dovyalis caffra]|uniref:Aminotransferase-like plant mobile domain-containing protein n=1 Tax=Dovyalis caffra TaxID=77055 RepID=A0AAV1RPA3_9ROSI|nr:unnamed protein product [Dovyalis caffra]
MEREENELEDEIKEAGHALLSPPSSVSQLIFLLEKLENCLTRVDQSPSNSMQKAVELAMKALMTKELLNHLDVDDVLPIAQKLGERVFENCGSKLARYMPQANYSGQKRSRGRLQYSGSHTELVVKEKNDREEGCGYQVFEEGNREEGERTKEKAVQQEDEISLGEFMKQMRSRKRVKTNQKPVVKEKNDREGGSEMQVFGDKNSDRGRKEEIDREESCKEQGFQEDHSEEGKKAKRKVFKVKRHHKKGVVFLGEIVKKNGSGARVRKDQTGFQEDHSEEGKKAKRKVFKVKKRQKKGVVFCAGIVEEKGRRARVRKYQTSRRKLKYKGKQAMDCKCNQRKMHEFLSNLKGKKRSIIANSIFSAFLDICNCPINRSLAAALIECYDAKTDAFVIAGQPLKFCGKEIEKCIGLSFEGKRVDINLLGGHNDSQIAWRYFQIVKGKARIKKKSAGAGKEKEDGEMRSSLSISSSLLLQELNRMSVDEKDEADNFLRLSILYMFNVYFFPSLSKHISWWPLKFLENLHDFGSYAWGRAAYDYLHKYLQKAAIKLAGQNKFYACLNGCVPLLQTLALERISKLRVLTPPTSLSPSILNSSKMNGMTFDAILQVLAELQPDEIKKCKDCEAIAENETRLQGDMVKRTKRQKWKDMGIEEDKRIEEDLFLIGNALVSSPSSVQQLNALLDSALNPVMKELMTKELLYHSDADVKVSVASCINQILRIKALDVPYGDERMKVDLEILQLIVAAFENLSDTTGPSYSKRVSILDTVANFGSWNLMVDLQCHSSIVEMFKHFLTNIR